MKIEELINEIDSKYVKKEDFEEMMKQKGIPEDKQKSIMGLIDHFKQGCNDDKCEVHKVRNEIEEDSFALGYLLRDMI